MSFVERMKKVISQGFDTTKEALTIAAEKAKELGEKGVIKFEISRLEKDVEKKFALLGSQVFAMLVEEKKQTVTSATPEVKSVIDDILEYKEKIEEKEQALKDVDLKKDK